MKILVSAAEASADRHAAEVVEQLRARFPDADFFGCAGPRMRAAGVRAVERTEDLSVVGIFEVIAHAPRIYRLLFRLAAAAREEKPDLAIVTDAPGFHIDLCRFLKRQGVPIVWYVGPQVWAWRKGRIRVIRRLVTHLLCIFPFEEKFFRDHGVATTYVGHPLSRTTKTTKSRADFLGSLGLSGERPVVALLPGSRRSEASRHLPHLLGAVEQLGRSMAVDFVLAASHTTGKAFFEQRIGDSPVHIVEDDMHNAVGHADLALVASGTASTETALLGTPMVTFYRISFPSWVVAKMLVDVPFYTMVNLLANRRLVPELIQWDCTADKIAGEARRLLGNDDERRQMREELSVIAEVLSGDRPAAERAAEVICDKVVFADEQHKREPMPVS